LKKKTFFSVYGKICEHKYGFFLIYVFVLCILCKDKQSNKDVTGENLSIRYLTWRICGGNWGLMGEGGRRPFVSKQVI